jgi:hypothetical protein
LYPDANYQHAYSLCYYLATIQYEYILITEGSAYVFRDTVFSIENKKIYWLFYGVPFENFVNQLRALIIERNDISLSEQDYILLVYVSLQSDKVRKSLERLPLNMLYDIFSPIADANQKKWITD